jgi:hypothetical protein
MVTTFTALELNMMAYAAEMAFDLAYTEKEESYSAEFVDTLDNLLDKLKGLATEYPAKLPGIYEKEEPAYVETVFSLTDLTPEQFNDLAYCVDVYIENIGDVEADDPDCFARITRLPKALNNHLGVSK